MQTENSFTQAINADRANFTRANVDTWMNEHDMVVLERDIDADTGALTLWVRSIDGRTYKIAQNVGGG